MRKFTTAVRQKIIDDYVARHGGYDPVGFLREVRLSNGNHPAWSWFTWEDHKAAEEHRLWQCRTFVQGLTVKFEIETLDNHVMKIEVKEAPAYLSPVEGRRDGGGYYQFDYDNPDHRAELASQALQSLDTWVRRYGGIYEALGGRLDDIRAIRAAFETKVAA